MGLLYGLVAIAELILLLYCLIDIISKGKSTVWKVIWVLIIICFPLLGAIAYILLGKNS